MKKITLMIMLVSLFVGCATKTVNNTEPSEPKEPAEGVILEVPDVKMSETPVIPQKSKEEIRKWRGADNDAATALLNGTYTFRINNNDVSINIIYDEGSIVNENGSLQKIAQGNKVVYENDHGDYYLIFNNGTLGLCDDMGCFKTLYPIQ